VRDADAPKDRVIEAKVPRQQMGVWTWCRRTIPIQQPALVRHGAEELARGHVEMDDLEVVLLKEQSDRTAARLRHMNVKREI
jgi:hypothetical protein